MLKRLLNKLGYIDKPINKPIIKFKSTITKEDVVKGRVPQLYKQKEPYDGSYPIRIPKPSLNITLHPTKLHVRAKIYKLKIKRDKHQVKLKRKTTNEVIKLLSK